MGHPNHQKSGRGGGPDESAHEAAYLFFRFTFQLSVAGVGSAFPT
jgi:hypothetical protein